ncbi:MAG: hypothetical protein HPY89_08260 [Pelotomaculum sp.]|nr:hypothetical protein [Pelotomaculum sp.]
MGNFEQQTGLAKNIPTRLAGPGDVPFVKRRPTVDTRGIATGFFNAIVGKLDEYDEKAKKRNRFLDPTIERPKFPLKEMAEGVRAEVEAAYKQEIASLKVPYNPPEGELDALEDEAVRYFLTDVYRLAKASSDDDLRQQCLSLMPELEPPALDNDQLKQLGVLQRRFDKVTEDIQDVFATMLEALAELDAITREESSLLAGTNQIGNDRLMRQREYLRYELVRALETGRQLDLKIPVARW